FSWKEGGIYEYAGTPASGYLKKINPFINQYLINKKVIWFDFPHRFQSFGFQKEKELKNIIIFRPENINDALVAVDNLEYKILLKKDPLDEYFIVADFPFWYIVLKGLNQQITTKLNYILALLQQYSENYNIQTLLINELRTDIETGYFRPYLEYITQNYVFESFFLEK
ncbi:MAG: hypothetical protein ACFFD1_16055, partial [Candidatus Thorarchaeota archaeon]